VHRSEQKNVTSTAIAIFLLVVKVLAKSLWVYLLSNNDILIAAVANKANLNSAFSKILASLTTQFGGFYKTSKTLYMIQPISLFCFLANRGLTSSSGRYDILNNKYWLKV